MFAARRNIVLGTVLGCFAFTAACEDSPTEPSPVEWAAEIEDEDVSAIVEVVARRTTFSASIEITDATPDETYTWRIASGTCAAPGDRIGAANRYPELEIGDDGTAEAVASVSAALSSSGNYIASILDESGAQPVVVACAPLEVVD